MKLSPLSLLSFTVLSIATSCVGSERLDPAPAELLGRWRGEATAVVAWANRQHVTIDLAFAENGTVAGKIGDAVLVDGYVARNRGDLGRALGTNSDFIVRGALEGTVLPREPVTSKVLFIPFNIVTSDGSAVLTGGVTTCKTSHGAGKDHAVAAKDMELHRSP
jgi:hypothetical protein